MTILGLLSITGDNYGYFTVIFELNAFGFF